MVPGVAAKLAGHFPGVGLRWLALGGADHAVMLDDAPDTHVIGGGFGLCLAARPLLDEAGDQALGGRAAVKDFGDLAAGGGDHVLASYAATWAAANNSSWRAYAAA